MPQTSCWYIYLIECSGGSLYTGITPDLAARFTAHLDGKGAMFTRLNPPVRMIAAKSCANRSQASRLERALKGVTRAQKLFLVASWPLRDDLPQSNRETIPRRRSLRSISASASST